MWLPYLPSISIATNQILAINNAAQKRKTDLYMALLHVNAFIKSTGGTIVLDGIIMVYYVLNDLYCGDIGQKYQLYRTHCIF